MSNEQKRVFAEMIEEFYAWLAEQKTSAWFETESLSAN